jgi:toxin ParE1/3/4
MSRKLIICNRATQDLRQQANCILGNGSAGAAEQFLELAEATFAQILTVPRIGKSIGFVLERMGEVRQWRIKNFQDYLIFYRVQDDQIEILRILHGSRDLEGILVRLDVGQTIPIV